MTPPNCGGVIILPSNALALPGFWSKGLLGRVQGAGVAPRADAGHHPEECQEVPNRPTGWPDGGQGWMDGARGRETQPFFRFFFVFLEFDFLWIKFKSLFEGPCLGSLRLSGWEFFINFFEKSFVEEKGREEKRNYRRKRLQLAVLSKSTA